jgi:4-amino-4-deoxy-L-arabinose transferase-like glycosyltransferase
VRLSRTWIVLLAVVAVAALARSVDIGRNPPGLFVDEAFKGYDAYSILKTGRDLWGERLPLFFRSWGDYNSGLYRYLTVPWVAALGLDETAVRATGVLFGTLTILAVFLLGRRLFSERVGLVAAVLLAVSPWHFQFSRSGFRGILLPFFLTISVLLLLRALERKRWWIVAASSSFGVTAYTYAAAPLMAPLMLAVLLAFHRRELRLQRRYVVLSIVAFLVILSPIVHITASGKGMYRYELISVFKDGGTRADPARVATTFARNYVSHFGPRFLLISGDTNLRHSPRGVGELNWAEFALFWAGVAIALIKRGKYLIPLAWVLIAFVPGSLTSDNVPNALRAIGALPAVQLIAATAFVWLMDRARPALVPLVVVGLVGSTIHLHNYFTRYKVEAATWWEYGYREAIAFCEDVKDDYDGIVIVAPDRAFMAEYRTNPYDYAFALFYARCDPAALHRTRRPGKYAMVDAPKGALVDEGMFQPGILYVVRAHQAGRVRPLRVVDYPSGKPAFIITARTPKGAEPNAGAARGAAALPAPTTRSQTP